MNLNDISTQLLYVTVPLTITTASKTKTVGTGFLVEWIKEIPNGAPVRIPLLVTNSHVLNGYEKIELQLHLADEKGNPINGTPLTVNVIELKSLIVYNQDQDIAVIFMGPIFNKLTTEGRKFFYRSIPISFFPEEKIIEDFSALEEIMFIGYPSGIQDLHNFNPLMRRGITATPIWQSFNGTPRFVIDAGIFPGSSGSPVFILNQGSYVTKEATVIGNRCFFVGMITTAFSRKEVENQNVYLGLGEAINSEAIRKFISSIVAGLVV